MPQHIAYATGEGAVLSAGSRIAVPGGAKALRSVAELFVRDICREHGLRLKVSGISESGIVLGIDPALRAEAYSLDIAKACRRDGRFPFGTLLRIAELASTYLAVWYATSGSACGG